eukprot:768317-Hanusia_phi.AAC.2
MASDRCADQLQSQVPVHCWPLQDFVGAKSTRSLVSVLTINKGLDFVENCIQTEERTRFKIALENVTSDDVDDVPVRFRDKKGAIRVSIPLCCLLYSLA